MPLLGELGRVERSSRRELRLWRGLVFGSLGWEGVGVRVGVREEKLPPGGGAGEEEEEVVVVVVVGRCLDRPERRRWCLPMARASLLKIWVTSVLVGGLAWWAGSFSSWAAMLAVGGGVTL
jgi:hypothetical protein